jgi:hypothetical protein
VPIVFLVSVSVANLWDYMKHSCRESVHIYRPTMYGMDHLALHSSSTRFLCIDIFRILVGCTWTVRNCYTCPLGSSVLSTMPLQRMARKQQPLWDLTMH